MRPNTNAFLLFLLIAVISLFWNIRVSAPEEPDPEVLRPRPVTLTAVGDILLSRHVGTRIDAAANPSLPFELVKNVLTEADIAFGNLECPLSETDIPVREGLAFRCLTKYVSGLTDAGFDVLSTANNHSFDQGLDSVNFTVQYLLNENILPVGTGHDFDEAHRGQIIERGGIKFGFLAYSYTARNDGGRSQHPQISTTHNIENLRSDIANLSAKGESASGGKSTGADIIIISMHAGTEYTRNPNEEQTTFARAAIDAGADVVIGHHPHWIQTLEIYRGKPIFYSLGNFVFDQMWSEQTREGLMVRFEISDKRLETAKLLPVIIDNFCCPRPATAEEAEMIFNKIDISSDTLYFE